MARDLVISTGAASQCIIQAYTVLPILRDSSFDSYPQGFDCAHPRHWQPVIETYAKFHKRANPHQPLYIPEFQGGAYDAWVRKHDPR